MTRCAAIRLGLLGGLLGALLGSAAEGDVAPHAHPHFDDGGTLRWTSSFAEAAGLARAEGRLIFMEMGRAVCPPCQSLVSRVLPDPRVRVRLQRVAVGLAVDADRPGAFIDALRRRELPRETLLPMTAFLTADGAWITGASGALDVEGFARHLARAEAYLARHGQAPVGPRAAALPRPQSSAAPRPAPPSTLPPPAVRRAPTAAVPPAPAPFASAPPSTVRHAPRLAPPAPPAPCAVPPSAAPEPCDADGPRISCCVVRMDAPLEPAERCAREGRWGEVLRLTRSSRDARLQELERSAHRWGERELERALGEVVAGRPAAACTSLLHVQQELAGAPAAADASRGLDAIETLRDLAQLSDPAGLLARTLRQNKREELRGSRWARLFSA